MAATVIYMTNTFHVNDYVAWKWAGGMGHGTVSDIAHDRVEIESKGKVIVRRGSQANPAVTITDHNGTIVLKLASELEKTTEAS